MRRYFHTGNHLVHQGRLSGTFDRECTSVGDLREDLGWFSACCWRLTAPRCEGPSAPPIWCSG
ncbi:hypothetical protein MMK89_005015, partial [Pseudomonas aeruginosa]